MRQSFTRLLPLILQKGGCENLLFILMNTKKRKKIFVQGIVQGIGFRPFVYRQAMCENLKGFVANTSQGLEIEVEGDPVALERFLQKIQSSPPPLARIRELKVSEIPVEGEIEFLIQSSKEEEERSTLISPDISICNDCLRELFDPKDRRYRYPFINCTNCGPRYTIIKDIPYDRPKTTMFTFKMCPDCHREYNDPRDRRFHSQPNACSVCGPRVWLTDTDGKEIKVDDPILESVRQLREGKILAVKGLGGFHLACDATNEEAVSRLRQRKGREEKPLAVMALDLVAVETFADPSSKERDLLLSPRRPIVLLRKKIPNILAESVSPRNLYFGTMLAYTPLHYLILNEGFTALVMTSGNISEEPIAIGNEEALTRLCGISDFFLMHDREIYLRNDDSVVRVTAGLPRFVRRSRGYVPVPVFLRRELPQVLAVGAELKNTICILKKDQAFLSQHVGDIENEETLKSFEESVNHLTRILQIQPVAIAYDLHPDYLSTQWALEQNDISHIGVQHHHAHIAACLAENGREERVIGLSLDGTGYGLDGRIWGGEILVADFKSFERVGHFDYRPMPGGVIAIKEPWRMAVAYLYSVFKRSTREGEKIKELLRWLSLLPFGEHVDSNKIRTVVNMIQHGINIPQTSSLGRLFDGVAALIGVRERVAFEGQAAMELEMSMGDTLWDRRSEKVYNFEVFEKDGDMIISMDEVVLDIKEDFLRGVLVKEIALKFHISLVQLFLKVCKDIRKHLGINIVALSGGCFQNRFLLENLSALLEESGFEVLTHSVVPTNDGGLALGQAVVASYQIS